MHVMFSYANIFKTEIIKLGIYVFLIVLDYFYIIKFNQVIFVVFFPSEIYFLHTYVKCYLDVIRELIYA